MEKNQKRISLATYVITLILMGAVIIGLIFIINKKENTTAETTNSVVSTANTVNGKTSTISNTSVTENTTLNNAVNTIENNKKINDIESKKDETDNNTQNNTTANTKANANVNTNTNVNTNINSNDTKYEISIRDEIYATIKATKNGKTVTKEFEMGGAVAETGTMTLPTIGTVALVANSGGEYYGVNVYQLVNGKIEELGKIDCSADMVKDATYEVTTKGETTAVITAKRNSENIKKEFEMDATIAKTEVIDVFKCGKVVLVAETGGEYYAFKVFRLSQDYTDGKTKGIVEAGTIKYIF